KVFLIGNHYTKNGIVRSCHEEGDSFLLTILIDSEHSGPELLPEYDPGLFGVDDFLTEEEESKILEGLDIDSNIRREISWIPEKTMRLLLHSSFSVVLFSLVGMILLGPEAHGQVVTATLTGTVTDSTGASVPNAAVTATQISTGVARSTKTNEEGVYSIPYLNP